MKERLKQSSTSSLADTFQEIVLWMTHISCSNSKTECSLTKLLRRNDRESVTESLEIIERVLRELFTRELAPLCAVSNAKMASNAVDIEPTSVPPLLLLASRCNR